jgi:hypothetical protein
MPGDFGFDSELLRKLEYLSLVSRRVFQGSILAQRRSLRTGSGLEFVDHREYTDADDFRYLDWNLFARQDRLMIKRYEEEQDLNVYLLLDCSRSMGMGQPSKFVYARQVAAALAYIALADLDRVSVTPFAAGLGRELPPSRGKDCVLGLIRFLEGLPLLDEPTDLARAASAFSGRARRRGFVIVISDWLDRAGFRGRSTRSATRGTSFTSWRSTTRSRPTPRSPATSSSSRSRPGPDGASPSARAPGTAIAGSSASTARGSKRIAGAGGSAARGPRPPCRSTRSCSR